MNPAGEDSRISRVLLIGLALFASLAAPYALGIIPAAIQVSYLAAMLAASLVLAKGVSESARSPAHHHDWVRRAYSGIY